MKLSVGDNKVTCGSVGDKVGMELHQKELKRPEQEVQVIS